MTEYNDIQAKHGPPHDNIDRLEILQLPRPLRLSWDLNTRVRRAPVHPAIRENLRQALTDIFSRYDDSLDELGVWGGCYCKRKTRGSSGRWSVHSWGLAVDFLPALGQLGARPMTPAWIVSSFKAAGFLWGGDWAHPDGMHFTIIEE